MKNSIYYFSGTGNSLYVAKKIQEKLGEIELIQITSEVRDRHISIEAEILGFVFPVYFFGWPVIVEEFLKQATISKPGYLFVVATHGGGPANALNSFAKVLSKKGLTNDSAFDLAMPGNYIVLYNSPAGENIRQMLAAADVQLTAIGEKIGRREKIPASGGILDSLKSAVVYPFFVKMVYKRDQKFSASNQCTGCGICRKVCPVHNIILNTAQKPEWQHQCEKCLACINWCPVQAIEYGEATQGRNRYHHPEITAAELSRK